MSSCPWAHLARWASCSSCPALCTSPAVCSRMASTLARLRTRVLISSARRWIWSGAAGSDSSSTRLATTSMLSGSAPSSAGGSSHCVPYSTPGWRGQADQRGTWDRAGGVGGRDGWRAEEGWGRAGTMQCSMGQGWHSPRAVSRQCSVAQCRVNAAWCRCRATKPWTGVASPPGMPALTAQEGFDIAD